MVNFTRSETKPQGSLWIKCFEGLARIDVFLFSLCFLYLETKPRRTFGETSKFSCLDSVRELVLQSCVSQGRK